MNGKPRKIICKFCLKDFTGYRSNTKTCSPKCGFKLRQLTFIKCKEKKCINKVLDYRATYCRHCFKLGGRHPSWKGNKVGYSALHQWVKRHKFKPNFCENCGKRIKLDLANISQKYKRDLSDWEWLCRKCHMKKDGRLKNLITRIIIRNKLCIK